MDSPGFEISISGRDDGTLEAVYIRCSEGKVHHTDEIKEDVVLADYDSQGNLLGIEILAPVKLRVLSKLIDEDHRRPFRKFIRKSAPQEFLVPG